MSEISVTQQALEKRQVRLTVTIPSERIEKALRAKAQKLGKQVRIPGFRPGKAPYHVIVQRMGREALLQEVLEEMGDKVYAEAREQTEVEPYGRAILEDLTMEEPYTMVFDVPLKPIVDPGDYRSLRVPYAEPSEEEIQKDAAEEIKHMLSRRSVWEPVERPVEFDDLVTISIKLTVDDEVVLENDDWDIVPDPEEYTLAPEFDGQFIGMSVGESKSFTAPFPEDSETAWAGKEGHFEVTVKTVKAQELPELDDELAASIGEFASADALRQAVYDHAAGHAQERADDAFVAAVLDALVAQAAQLDYPDEAIEQQINFLASEQESLYRRYGIESLEELLRLQRKSMEEFRAEMREPAEDRLQRNLLIEAIGEREQMPVSDYEIDQYFVREIGDNEEALQNMRASVAADPTFKDYFADAVKNIKTRELILAIARGEEVPEPGQHVAEEAPEVEPEAEVEETAQAESEEAVIEEAAATDVKAEAEEVAESESASQPESNAEATLVE